LALGDHTSMPEPSTQRAQACGKRHQRRCWRKPAGLPALAVRWGPIVECSPWPRQPWGCPRCALIFAGDAACSCWVAFFLAHPQQSPTPGLPAPGPATRRFDAMPGRPRPSKVQPQTSCRSAVTGLRQQIGPAYEPAPWRCRRSDAAPHGPLRTSVRAGPCSATGGLQCIS
jgi:hypothetical protein